jgi:hypothetical protein
VEDVGEVGNYHIMAALYVEGGGTFQPKSNVDYMGYSEMATFGDGKVELFIELELAP